jgi:hypothetical protein
MSIRPLDGITVVSLEHAIAAPFCTRQLADLGARIINEAEAISCLNEFLKSEFKGGRHQDRLGKI